MTVSTRGQTLRTVGTAAESVVRGRSAALATADPSGPTTIVATAAIRVRAANTALGRRSGASAQLASSIVVESVALVHAATGFVVRVVNVDTR